MTLTATELRENIYRILDQILESGTPVEITRHGKLLRIVPVDPISKLERLPRRDLLACDPEELVHLDWSVEWRP